ncbi:unnamed protein product [Cunninghamella blakesleeana]
MSIENKDPTISIVDCAFEGSDGKQNKTIDITEIKPSKSNDSSINTLSSNECRSPSSLYNNDALSRRPSSLNLGKSAAYSAISDVSSFPILSDLLSSINNNYHHPSSPPSYSLENAILIIIMPNSIIDKDISLLNIEKQEFRIIDQQSIQLSSSQIDHLFEESTIKTHYKQLYDVWKEISLSEKVQVVLLEKENAINEFQTLLTTQNNTKKKNRIIDPLSIYASISQENTKNSIELLLKPVWDRQASNNLGESVSSASFVLPSGTYENHDTVIHYASKEKKTTTVVIDGKLNIENNEGRNTSEKVSAAIESLKLNAKKSNASLKNSIKIENKQLPPIPLSIENEEDKTKKESDIFIITTTTETTVMKQHDSIKDLETKKGKESPSPSSSSPSVISIIIDDNKSDDHLLMEEKNNTINNNNNNKECFNYSETSTITKISDTIKSDSDTTTETIKKEIMMDSTATSKEENKEPIDENKFDTEKEVLDTSIATNDDLENVNDLPMNQTNLKESYDKEEKEDEENKKIKDKTLINDTNQTIKTKIAVLDKQKAKDLDENKTSNKKIETRKEKSPPKYGSIKKKTLASQKQSINNDKANKLTTTSIPTIRSKTKDENKTNDANNKNRIPRVALLANDKVKKNRTTTVLSDTIIATEESPSSSSSHEKKKTKNITKPKKAITSSAIARLTAPTASSARRKQSTVNGKVISSTTMINTVTTTMTEKPSSTTAFIRFEGKRRVSSASKKESSLPISKPLPPVPSININKDEKNTAIKDDSKQSLKESSIENIPLETEAENNNDEEKTLEIKIPQDRSNFTNLITSTDNEEIQETTATNNNENDDDDDNITSDNKIEARKEPLSPRSPESSSTSSRPSTPPQQENSTGVTLDTVNITMKQGNNSNVKDMLQRFT